MSIGYHCPDCARVVEVSDAKPPRYRPHTTTTYGSARCARGGQVVPLSLRQPPASRHGDGMAATAPCGHPGRHVTANMVLCEREWCDGRAPAPVAPCAHADVYVWSTYSSCKACGKIVKGKP